MVPVYRDVAEKMAYNLPDQKLIAKRQKTAYMIRISYTGICGEEEFKCH
jgi:hypothetical protein